MSDFVLPISSPSAEGVDARGIIDLVEALEARPDVEPHGLTIVRHGREIASGHWAPYRRDEPRLLYSLSKSFTSTAVGFAVNEGLFGLDDLVLDHFPEYAADAADDRVRSWTVRQLLTMSSGHVLDTWDRIFDRDEDPVRLFLRLAPEREPGTWFTYNQGCTYTVAAILQKRAGCTLPEYLQPRLFDVVGGGSVSWMEEPAGRSLGFSGLFATHDDVVRLGQLYLQQGQWDSSSVLPSSWVSLATSRQIETSPPETNPDWRVGYGLQFWMARHGYRGDGAYGQFCIVLPSVDAVVVITSATENMQGVLDDVYAHLLPAFSGAGSLTADAELATRLSALTLPVPIGPAAPDDSSLWDGLVLEPAGGVCSAQPSLASVVVSRAAAGWQFSLIENQVSFTVDLASSWVVGSAVVSPGGEVMPVACAGAFGDPGKLHALVRFMQTPHALRLTLDATTRTFEASWPTEPLHKPPLHQLHAPSA